MTLPRQKLKAARIAKGIRERRCITQQKAAKEIGCSVEIYSMWERGKSFPQEYWRAKLLEYFEVESLADLDLFPAGLGLYDVVGMLEQYNSHDVLIALQELPIFKDLDLIAFAES